MRIHKVLFFAGFVKSPTAGPSGFSANYASARVIAKQLHFAAIIVTRIFKLVIFTALAAAIATPASAQEIVITAVGDVMLAGSGAALCGKLGYDYPFAATKAELQKGDIAIANLESPLAKGGKEFSAKRYHYRSSPRAAEALKNAGFGVVTLANNHMMDFGDAALTETGHYLDKVGIISTGGGETLAAARKPAIVSMRGKKVAFLAYSLTFPASFYASSRRAGTAPGFPRYFREDIASAKKKADYVVVSFHWGAENSVVTKPYQILTAHSAIDAGADLVLGHHPHVLQGIERYKKGAIFYSLGNFTFNTASRTAKRSVIARISLERGIGRIELVPLNVLNSEVHFQPKVLAGKEGQEVIAHLGRLSGRWHTSIKTVGGRYLVEVGSARHVAKR